ncbi:NmrA family NAD(P)-binding protein [Ruegeria faecimaris]|uniref:NmrA family NAD(P)-binding protein n=1 Tax=Ruegeria faecimaris TaxID=686389 RepID=UPI002492BAD0|nr:NmrA family NAD(P)-binding protein [Ruegeria faecimaris]
MPTKPKILVTSASGKTGLQVAHQLRAKGYQVRAFIRQRDHRSDMLDRAGAELFVGDQYSLSDMRKAMKGVQRAYQCAPTAPNGLHFTAVFTAAAYEAKVEHVVTLSQWLSSVDHPSLFTREVYLGDILIGMRPEMSVTTVNVGWFAENYLMVLGMAAHLGQFTMPLGDGDVKKNAAPSNEDIASVVVGALTDPAHHAGKTYRPTGPTLLSPNEIAEAMGRALGRRVRYVDISERMMVKALKALRPANYSEAAVTQLAIYSEEYRRGAFAVNAPTEDVFQVSGHEPEAFESIVRRKVADQPGLARSLPGSIGAIGSFLKILTTRPFDLDRAQMQRDYVQLSSPSYCQDDAAWAESHQPTARKTAPMRVA